MKKLSKRDMRALVILIGFAGLSALAFFVILPFWDAQSQVSAELDQQVEILAHSVHAIESQERFRQQLAALDQELSGLERQLLSAPSSSVAQTQLLEILTGLAEDNAVTLTRSSPVPDRTEGAYTWVGLQVNLECQIVELTNFLRSIATHPNFLVVDEFSLTIGRVRRNQVPALRPRIKVSGLIRLS